VIFPQLRVIQSSPRYHFLEEVVVVEVVVVVVEVVVVVVEVVVVVVEVVEVVVVVGYLE
jgi:hypothetical protein